MSKKMIILYSSAEYDCCGPYFSLNEYVWWHIEKISTKRKIGEKEIKIENYCGNCSCGGDRIVSGLITKIEVIKNNSIKECNESYKNKQGYDYLITLTNVEEFFYSEMINLNLISNPFIINKKLNDNMVYSNINLIGDLNHDAIYIAKKYNQNHFGINFFSKNQRKYKDVYNELKNIRSYSTNEYCNINIFNNEHNNYHFKDSLNIIISETDEYDHIYDILLKLQENNYSNSSICYIKMLKDYYEVTLNNSRLSKNILDIWKYKLENRTLKHINCLKINTNNKLIFKNKEKVINFTYNRIYKNTR